MTKQEFDDLQRQLKEQGYRHMHGCQSYCWKSIVRRPTQYGNLRGAAIIKYDIYDMLTDCVPTVIISRRTDERIDIEFTAPRLPIDELEVLAKKLIAFFDENLKQ